MRARSPESAATGGWYVIFENGEVHAWRGSIEASQARAPLAVLGAVYNTNPERLINAQQPSGDLPVTDSLSGNTLTISPANDYTGSFNVTVTASDGSASAVQSFQCFGYQQPAGACSDC